MSKKTPEPETFVYRIDTPNKIAQMNAEGGLTARGYDPGIKEKTQHMPREVFEAQKEGFEIPDSSLLKYGETAVISFFLDLVDAELRTNWGSPARNVLRISWQNITSQKWYCGHFVDGAMSPIGRVIYCPCNNKNIGDLIIGIDQVEFLGPENWHPLKDFNSDN